MKAVVCGAGIAGLTLARRLEQLGWDVVVLERAPGPRPQGYMMDFYGPGYDTAQALGALPALREIGYRVTEAGYYDARGRRTGAISFTRFADRVDGRMLSLLRPDLERALRGQLADRVDLRFGATLTDVVDHGDRVEVSTDGGEHLTADALVGADGIHSTVRRIVFGDEQRFLRQLGFHTAAYVFDDPVVHAEVGDRFCLTDTAYAAMGFYALRGGRVATFAVHRTADPTLPADARAALREVCGSLSWLAPRALAACPEPSQVYYDQVAQVEMPRWSSGRVTLVGDAGFAVSLLSGQGASLGMAGAYLLAEKLTSEDTVAAALAAYEDVWRPVVTEKQRVARASARWFLPSSRRQLLARRLALKVFQLPGLDRLLVGALTGKTSTVVRDLHAARSGRGDGPAPTPGLSRSP